jgi:MFS family permease
VFGGLLTELGWRFTFFLPVPIALAVLIAAPRFLGRDAGSERRSRGIGQFDIAGALSVTVAMLGLVFTVVNGPTVGWGSTRTLVSFAGVVGLFAIFVGVEQNATRPLVRLGILHSGRRCGVPTLARWR